MQAAAEALRFIQAKERPLSSDVRAFLELPSWEAERGILATSLADDVWQTVSHCVEGIDKGRRALSVAPYDEPLHPGWIATARQASGRPRQSRGAPTRRQASQGLIARVVLRSAVRGSLAERHPRKESRGRVSPQCRVLSSRGR